MLHSVRPVHPKPFHGIVGAPSTDVENFIFAMELFFDLSGVVSETKKVALALTYVAGDALMWSRTVVATHAVGVLTWPVLRQLLLDHWRPVDLVSQARDDWAACK